VKKETWPASHSVREKDDFSARTYNLEDHIVDKRLQEMLDHYEISKLLSEYCHGLDRMDESRMASVYAKESWDDHGPNKCPGPEFAQRIMKLMQMPASIMGSHMLGQSLIKVDGDRAGAE
jgi:SnoaL-like domain